jgi:hypothetical protein
VPENYLAVSDQNLKPPLSKRPAEAIETEIAAVDAAIERIQNHPLADDPEIGAWFQVGNPTQAVALKSLRKYRRRLTAARR